MGFPLKRAVLGVTLFLAAAMAEAQSEKEPAPAGRTGGDWPQWRGPDRKNISPETGLLKEWPAEGPPLAWEARGIGNGIPGVAVSGGRIFLIGYIGESEYVTALSEVTGDRLWARRIGPSVRESPSMRWLGQRTPTVDGARLYAFRSDGRLVALRTDDGKELWRKDYIADFGGRRPGFGYCDYPLVDGERLICTPAGSRATMAALDKRTGRTIWTSRVPTTRPSHSAVVRIETAGIPQYVTFVLGKLLAFHARDGKPLWTYEPYGRTANSCTPIAFPGGLILTTGYGHDLVRVEPRVSDGKVELVEKYEKPVRVSIFQDSGLVVGPHLYMISTRGLTRLDLETGDPVGEPLAAYRGNTSMVYADGHLYLLTYAGAAARVRITPEGFVDQGSFNLPVEGRVRGSSHPVVAGGRLYLRHNDRLFAYDVKEDAAEGKPAPPRRIVLPAPTERLPSDAPAAESGAIFVRTPQDVVEKMLETAGVRAEDVVFDLGSGDGRIVVTAARTYGCKAVGFETNEDLVASSRENVRKEALERLVRIEQRDLFTADLSGASVVAVYLPKEFLTRLLPRFAKLKPGSRIVSHEFEIPGVKPDRTITVDSAEDGEKHRIHLWTAPLKKGK